MDYYEKKSKFYGWINENYNIESLENMIETKVKRNSIQTKVYWNKSRYYPEVGDYVTDVSAGHKFTYVGKVVERSKGKRPYYNIEILYSFDGKRNGNTDHRKNGCMLAIIEKKENWKEFCPDN